jgi:hypothetical protein
MESQNKGPHFWDESHPWDWYTEMYSPVAQKIDAQPDTFFDGLTIDASSNTFTVSGVNMRGRSSEVSYGITSTTQSFMHLL